MTAETTAARTPTSRRAATTGLRGRRQGPRGSATRRATTAQSATTEPRQQRSGRREQERLQHHLHLEARLAVEPRPSPRERPRLHSSSDGKAAATHVWRRLATPGRPPTPSHLRSRHRTVGAGRRLLAERSSVRASTALRRRRTRQSCLALPSADGQQPSTGCDAASARPQCGSRTATRSRRSARVMVAAFCEVTGDVLQRCCSQRPQVYDVPGARQRDGSSGCGRRSTLQCGPERSAKGDNIVPPHKNFAGYNWNEKTQASLRGVAAPRTRRCWRL